MLSNILVVTMLLVSNLKRKYLYILSTIVRLVYGYVPWYLFRREYKLFPVTHFFKWLGYWLGVGGLDTH